MNWVDDKTRIQIRDSLIRTGRMSAQDANAATDLAIHAANEAMRRLLDVVTVAEGTVWLNASAIAYQLLPSLCGSANRDLTDLAGKYGIRQASITLEGGQ